jgi:hypothetical protein
MSDYRNWAYVLCIESNNYRICCGACVHQTGLKGRLHNLQQKRLSKIHVSKNTCEGEVAQGCL